jgi:hypothetical protein
VFLDGALEKRTRRKKVLSRHRRQKKRQSTNKSLFHILIVILNSLFKIGLFSSDVRGKKRLNPVDLSADQAFLSRNAKTIISP